jgi:transposase InsO family protein
MDEQEFVKKIEEITSQLPVYGYRRVAAVLRHRFGAKVGRKRVYRIMRERKLCLPETCSKKHLFRGVPFSLKTQTDHSYRLWGIDMTYIWCGEDAWCYFHGVIDHHDKELLGYL